ncbi:glycine zipper family protein [Albimonas sp. CAU 1670]|uniref:glycine zipper family protein n=1 Tax=Albimonas sp. CAU 1670 TaxID=3032599 RepID=UPI0023DBDF52|nr:glycine zipper family protein [Albimonas sp. CAU 1670]MDF2235755.1 glycine zipper family protein [Albimonas sp. CAU 1670]
MLKPVSLALMCLAAGGCAGMSDTEQRALTGTAVGAAGGAVVGAIAGDTAMGAAIGAGAGLVGGLVVDKVQKDKDAAYRRGVAAGRAGG